MQVGGCAVALRCFEVEACAMAAAYLNSDAAAVSFGSILSDVLGSAVSVDAIDAEFAADVDLTSVALQLFIRLPSAPTVIIATPNNVPDPRIWFARKSGLVQVLAADGVSLTTALDISTLVFDAGERGLLGMAFHPQYHSNGYVFLHYSRAETSATAVERYTISRTDPNVIDPFSKKLIFEAPQPSNNHNGGSLDFDNNGFLILALGDGGGSGDPFCNAQNLSSPLGKILRFDVNTPDNVPYAIPPGNPFVGVPDALPEILVYGLRNPWRATCDRPTGDLWIGDVGQGVWEEVNVLRKSTPLVPANVNYGWKLKEGPAPFSDRNCGGLTLDNVGPLQEAVYSYDHSAGDCSITGGYVYRGPIEALQGRYIFGDFCSKNIWQIPADAIPGSSPAPQRIGQSEGLWTFGYDQAHNLYAVGGNNVFKLVDTSVPVATPTPPPPPPTPSPPPPEAADATVLSSTRVKTPQPTALNPLAILEAFVQQAVADLGIQADSVTAKSGEVAQQLDPLTADLRFEINCYSMRPCSDVSIFMNSEAGIATMELVIGGAATVPVMSASSVALIDASSFTIEPFGDKLAGAPTAILGTPTDVQDPRIWFLFKNGVLQIRDAGGVFSTALDVSSKVLDGGERGMLGMAFHPNFHSNGFIFVHYSALGSGATVVERYTISADPNVVDPASAKLIFTTPQPYSNHNGGSLEFGNDGFLYLALGDGGSGGDPQCRAQDLTSPLGKILRFDINTADNVPYAIPAGNPYLGTAGALPELFAIGLRNPWRSTFDKETGDLWIADVGQGVWEEVNVFRQSTPVASENLNFGWKLKEGPVPYNNNNCGGLTLENVGPLVEGVYSYNHNNGDCSITGGFVYRGPIEALQGRYIFADYCSRRVWQIPAEFEPGSNPIAQEIGIAQGGAWTFGQDQDKNMYIVGGLYAYAFVSV
mmetsp:Transcript_4098/g.10660  ORF Transcript_4098/g.10660 Transcript_4098/m.10660 type:complete len:929 (+) Transcript_4098:26-2812(+)